MFRTGVLHIIARVQCLHPCRQISTAEEERGKRIEGGTRVSSEKEREEMTGKCATVHIVKFQNEYIHV